MLENNKWLNKLKNVEQMEKRKYAPRKVMTSVLNIL
jgi:hypothetical protein